MIVILSNDEYGWKVCDFQSSIFTVSISVDWISISSLNINGNLSAKISFLNVIKQIEETLYRFVQKFEAYKNFKINKYFILLRFLKLVSFFKFPVKIICNLIF